ncbi:MAG: redoxin domain-containing protein [Algoriphagus sp.]
MKKTLFFFIFLLGSMEIGFSQTLGQLTALEVKSGTTLHMDSLRAEKGLVLIFHDPKCPFAMLYQDRISSLVEKFSPQGIAFALVNPEAGTSEEELKELKEFLDTHQVQIPYLIDSNDTWISQFKVSKIPEAVVLIPGKAGLEVAYKGAIDNNPQAASAVSERYLERALTQVAKGMTPEVPQVRAVGCTIRSY